MSNINDAVERIRMIECPTGDLENRIIETLEDYDVVGKSKINLNREVQYDREEAQAYSVKVQSDEEARIIILAKSGLDDYVTKVEDAYMI